MLEKRSSTAVVDGDRSIHTVLTDTFEFEYLFVKSVYV